jgi:hypothetical protein
MRRPTFFISSTIYDFADLRSALKFYLEEQGCKVLASECNDFEKPLDKHSYEACLEAIRSADYFILLIGARVGGWYDQKANVSITQREYREAYQLHQAGKLKLLNFVRSEVWQAKEDRRELARYLDGTTLATEEKRAIANHSAKSSANAAFLKSFIDEVSRNEETKRAVRGEGIAPSGNWIHLFHGFRDIVDVLNGHVFASIPVEDMTMRRLLRGELREILGQTLVKIRDTVLSPKATIELFHQQHPITMVNKYDEYTTVSVQRWDKLATLGMHLLDRKLHPIVLPQILARATFLEYDLQSNAYVETPVHSALLKLQSEIRKYNRSSTNENLSLIFLGAPRDRPRGAMSVELETIKLVSLLHLFDRWLNIIELSKAIVRHLEGAAFVMPALRHDSPVQGMQAELDAERVQDGELNHFLADQS